MRDLLQDFANWFTSLWSGRSCPMAYHYGTALMEKGQSFSQPKCKLSKAKLPTGLLALFKQRLLLMWNILQASLQLQKEQMSYFDQPCFTFFWRQHYHQLCACAVPVASDGSIVSPSLGAAMFSGLLPGATDIYNECFLLSAHSSYEAEIHTASLAIQFITKNIVGHVVLFIDNKLVIQTIT